MRVRARTTNAVVTVDGQEARRIRRYVENQPPEHWDSPAGQTVKELLMGLAGTEDE